VVGRATASGLAGWAAASPPACCGGWGCGRSCLAHRLRAVPGAVPDGRARSGAGRGRRASPGLLSPGGFPD